MGRVEEREGYLEGEPRIFWRAYLPSAPIASVAIVHGYGEHSGRYRDLVEALTSRRIAAWFVDLRGHGRSAGPRGHVHRFDDYLEDVDRLLALAGQGMEQPPFLLGHSHGGLIVLNALAKGGRKVRGVILSAPYLELALDPPAWKLLLARPLRVVAPSLPIPSGLTVEMLTADEGRRKEADDDPLVFETATAGWFFAVREAQPAIREAGPKIEAPLLCLLPLADPVVVPAATEAFFATVASEDKSLIGYEGALHEPFNELPPIRSAATAAVAEWIVERVGAADSERSPAER